MGSTVKLPDYIAGLDFLGARSSREFLGTKEANPAIVIEESVPFWIQSSDMEDIEAAFTIFQEKVCVPGFPARYSPAFWLAHTSLTALYKVTSAHLNANFTLEVLKSTNHLLFDLWMTLISVGPGSAHLEMMNIILKNEHSLLWTYMASLEGERLLSLISTLKTDFIYDEDVPSDHYATLMETHIDKIFRHILTVEQYDEAHRGLLDLYVYYLGRMNHVPPHIGPRLSHLCFLICQKYNLENPYLGIEDWVVMRHHLKVIKDVVTDRTFTLASEAQYRAPITLEKIFQATVSDNMLELLFKEFMSLLATISNNNNSKKSRRLFDVYKTALFCSLELDKWKELPTWMFEPCITTMANVASTNGIEVYIEELFVCTLNECLLKFITLSSKDKQHWHRLLVNCVVSGRQLLVAKATDILSHPVLTEAGLFHWKLYVKEARMLVDIVADLPPTFLQDDEASPLAATVDACSKFLSCLLTHLHEADMIWRVLHNIQQCVIKCVQKGAPVKASIALMCLNIELMNFKDMDFIREILFSMEQLLQDPDCPYRDGTFAEVVERLLVTCLQVFRDKGYIPVDFNTLFSSISLSCLYGTIATDDTTHGSCDAEKSCDTEKSYNRQKSCDTQTCDSKQRPCDLYNMLYSSVVQPFIIMHKSHGTITSIATFVPNVVQLVQEFVVHGTSIARCVEGLLWLGTSCPPLITDHVTGITELFLDWNCYKEMIDILKAIYPLDNLAVSARLSDMFDKLSDIDREDRHYILAVIALVAQHQTQLISVYRVTCLLNMYPYESDMSQRLILEIIGDVSHSHPEFLASQYSLLTDDTKFPTHSMSGRVPILARLSQLGEEQSRKTIDYLLKHITSKDPAVAVPAVDALGPLLKDNPQYLQKHKQKIKTAYKGSSIPKVKDMCLEVLPEIHVSTKGDGVHPSPKDNKNATKSTTESKQAKQPRKPNATPQTKTVLQPGKSMNTTTSQQRKSSAPLRKRNSVEVPKTTRLPEHGGEVGNPPIETVDEAIDDSGTGRTVIADQFDQTHTPVAVEEDITCTSDIQTVAKPLILNAQGQQSTAVSPKDDDIRPTSDIHVPKVIAAEDSVGGNVKQQNRDQKGMEGNKQRKVEQRALESVAPKLDGIVASEAVEMAHTVKQLGNESDKQSQYDIHQPQHQPQMKKEVVLEEQISTKKKTETAELLGEQIHVKSENKGTINSQHISIIDFSTPLPVYLCHHSTSQDKVSLLRRHLHMAGYESSLGTEDTGSGDSGNSGMDGAKVVVVCLTQMFVQSTECCNQVQQAIDMGKPLVPLMLCHLSQSEGNITQLLGTRLCVRFYAKPSEERQTGTYWPVEKFHEVLLQFNYLGILPNDNLVTEAYRNWWLPVEEEQSIKSLETVRTLVSTGAADVFISYQWSAHSEAVSLYRHLTQLGYQCWLGVYHMGGSESLYNKIVQGLHECRVVVACITDKFELAENCQQEVIIAHALKRPIIPLVLETKNWPIGGKVGEIMSNHETAIIFKTSAGKDTLSYSGEKFEKFINILNKHTTSRYKSSETVDESNTRSKCIEFVDINDNGDMASDGNLSSYVGKTTNPRTSKADVAKSMQNVGQKSTTGVKNSQRNVDNKNSQHPETNKPQRSSTSRLKKSSSLIGIKNLSNDFLAQQLVTSKTDDDLFIVKKSYQEGILVDEHGYTRSKSCAIV